MDFLQQPQVVVALRMVGIGVAALILVQIARRLTDRFERRISSGELGVVKKAVDVRRAKTLGGLLRTTVSIVIWAAALLMLLEQFGVSIGPLIAAAGIGGVALGFGAQNMVRDFIGGFFILLENQYDVGDVVKVAGVAGAVEELNIRTTVLRDLEGIRHVIPNGEVRISSNLTEGFSRYLMVLPISYSDDPDKAAAIAQRVTADMRKEPDWAPKMPEELTMLGVDAYGESSIDLKCFVQTTPGDQWEVGRELLKRIKKAFDEGDITIPFPHRELIVRRDDTQGESDLT